MGYRGRNRKYFAINLTAPEYINTLSMLSMLEWRRDRGPELLEGAVGGSRGRCGGLEGCPASAHFGGVRVLEAEGSPNEVFGVVQVQVLEMGNILGGD